jgi:NAD(P)-dependent dehydrogenase (short-subunit alcohol dehydrogenase family)
MELVGKVTVVTGAAGGIGKALAEKFHQEGARVVLADLDEAALQLVAGPLNAKRPDSALVFAANLGTEAANAALVKTAIDTFGTVDLFFANAGVGSGSDLSTPEDVWETALTSTLMLTGGPQNICCPNGWHVATDTSAVPHRLQACSPKLVPPPTPSPSTRPLHSPNGYRLPTALAASKSVACALKVSTPTC